MPRIEEWPLAKLKNDLAEVVHERGGQLLCVNAELVQFKARKLAREAGAPHDNVKASRSCIQKFMHPAGFLLRRQTSIFQKLAAECEEKLAEFQSYVFKMRRERKYLTCQIANAGETL